MMDNNELIENIKKSCEQMKVDDIEENPESAYEEFQCHCCGESKILAGSLIYKEYRLCNDCVTLAEIAFALNKIKDIEELLDQMEDQRFDKIYESLFDVNLN